MKIKLTENDIQTAIKEGINHFMTEHIAPEGGYADYEDCDISYQSVYEQALDYLEGGHNASSARELISALGFQTESFNEKDYETAYDACEDALSFHYNNEDDTFFESKIRQMVKESIKRFVNEATLVPDAYNEWYQEEDYDGNTGKEGMVRSYDIGGYYMHNAENDAKECGFDDVAKYLHYWFNEIKPECPWYWQKLGSGYGFHGKTIFQDGGLVCKEIYDQIMFDEERPI